MKVVDLSSHSFQTTDASGDLHRQDSWHRLGHSTSVTPFLLAARGSMGIGLLEGQTSTSNNGINEGGQPRRRRSVLSEADLSTALNCPACGKVFAGTKRRYHLERHLITHTGERPFPCPHCPYRANVRENLARHIRHRHPNTVVPTEETRALDA
ncbi:Zinc finger protein 536-like 6 [Homarus americanus]|uniref:Zinc finger protein 536-like 6 n=1 Tax=Homarus americanus TaxID=6706 RepID=A0A8J5K5D5_HOMAM|nr:Zinc finger protein 536-like 6 [Homarus americanus]